MRLNIRVGTYKRKPYSNKNDKVILHSDQGSQYGSYDYKQIAKKYNITLSMIRRGNCYDNTVTKSFLESRYLRLEKLQLLKYLNI